MCKSQDQISGTCVVSVVCLAGCLVTIYSLILSDGCLQTVDGQFGSAAQCQASANLSQYELARRGVP